MSGNKNKHRHQTGGLQEKKIKIEPTKEEIKVEHKQEKQKRKEKAKERRKDKPSLWQRIRDIFAELKKVRWPTLPKAIAQTGVVLGVVVMFSIIVFGIDQGLGQLFNLLVRPLTRGG